MQKTQKYYKSITKLLQNYLHTFNFLYNFAKTWSGSIVQKNEYRLQLAE